MKEVPKFDTTMVENLAAAETGELPAIRPPAELMNVEQPVNLEDLFHELNSIAWTLEDECRTIDEVIATMQDKRAQKEAEYVPRIKELEEQIKAEILNQGKSFKCDWGKATHRKGLTTISWNDDALKGYAVEHPDILKFRTEKTGEPSVSLNVGYQV